MDKAKKPPFRVDADSCISLTDQVVRGFREAIRSGYYRPGDVLPTIRDLEKIFGVSLFVPREALSRLTKEGLVNPRPRIGSVVLRSSESATRRGHVMLVIPDVPGAYYANVFGDVLRERLAASGYSFTRASVPKDGKGRHAVHLLDSEYNRHIDLTVLLYDAPEIARYLSKKGVPFVSLGQKEVSLRHCIGNVSRPRNGVAKEFFEHCRAAGVRKVLVADWEGEGFSVFEGVPHPGVTVDCVRIPSRDGGRNPGDIQRGAVEYFRKALSARDKLPDLLFLTDDNIACGAFLAILESGIAVPRHLRVAVWSHLGGNVVFTQPLTRMEMDPFGDAHRVAEAIKRYLEGGVFPSGLVLLPRYVIAGTFP